MYRPALSEKKMYSNSDVWLVFCTVIVMELKKKLSMVCEMVVLGFDIDLHIFFLSFYLPDISS